MRCLLINLTSTSFCLAANLSAPRPHIDQLFRDVILNQDHRFRPTLNHSQPTLVYLSLMLLSLADVDEVRQSLTSNILLTALWQDEVRQWDPDNYGGLLRVHPDPLDIWRPRIFLANSIAERDIFKDNYAPLTINHTGKTRWLPGGILYTSCSMRMTYFPFDTQTCVLNFTSSEDSTAVQLIPMSSSINLDHYDRNGEWVIQSSEALVVTTLDGKSGIKFTFQLARLPSFVVLNVVFPVIIISSLACIVFLMPIPCGERVSFSVTVLLSLTVCVNEISKNLPTSSESLPYLIIYMTCLLLHSGLVIVANLFVLIRYYHLSMLSRAKYRRDDNHTDDGAEMQQNTNKEAQNSHKHLTNDELHLSSSHITIVDNRCSLTPALVSTLDNSDSSYYPKGRFKFTKLGKIYRSKIRTWHARVLKAALSHVMKYVSGFDLSLFALFFTVWVILTTVFLSVIS